MKIEIPASTMCVTSAGHLTSLYLGVLLFKNMYVCMYVYFLPCLKLAHVLQSYEASFSITFPPFMTTQTGVQIRQEREPGGWFAPL